MPERCQHQQSQQFMQQPTKRQTTQTLFQVAILKVHKIAWEIIAAIQCSSLVDELQDQQDRETRDSRLQNRVDEMKNKVSPFKNIRLTLSWSVLIWLWAPLWKSLSFWLTILILLCSVASPFVVISVLFIEVFPLSSPWVIEAIAPTTVDTFRYATLSFLYWKIRQNLSEFFRKLDIMLS